MIRRLDPWAPVLVLAVVVLAVLLAWPLYGVFAASLTNNRVKQVAADASASGTVTMTNAMGGQGILQANQNTGANAVQQNSVALTSTVGGNGGGLSGFSPTNTIASTR